MPSIQPPQQVPQDGNRVLKGTGASREEIPIAKPPSPAEQVLAHIGGVIGDSGTRRYSGYILQDYNPEWQNWDRVQLVEEMRRGDAACAAALRALKSPLLSTQWSVNTAGSSPKDQEIREFVEANLFGMRRSWEDFMREALCFLDFGHYVFELLWEVRDGQVWLCDLAPRIPKSIQRWRMLDGSPGITQYIMTNEFEKTMAEIPMDKLLVLTNDKEGDDLTGMSKLRPAYKHYYLKELLYKVQSIAAERFGVGIPTVKMGDSIGSADKSAAEDMAGSVRSNEKGYIVLPNGWEFDIVTPSGNPQAEAIISAIEHHSKMILMSVFAQFLGLGMDGAGSFALAKNHSSFFLDSTRDTARYFSGQINEQIIRKIVDVNFGPQEFYPTLNFAPMGEQDIKEFSEAMANLANAGFVPVNSRTIKHVNEVLGLPDLSEDEMEAHKEADIEAGIAGAAPPPEPEAKGPEETEGAADEDE